MQKNPYIVLGLSQGATFSEVHDAYHDLKIKYSSERFIEGEVGTNAAKMLAEIDIAYKDCLDDIKTRATIESTGSIYGVISDLIKSGKLSEAQRDLDLIETRDAEWHYYQSIVYYKNNWVMDSKKQLEIALALEPTNQKYKDALEKMLKAQPQPNSTQNAQGGQNAQYSQRGGYTQPPPTSSARNANACCNTCCTLVCCDSCCECCGGDLISCC